MLLSGSPLPPYPVSPILAGYPLTLFYTWRSVNDCVQLFRWRSVFSVDPFMPSPELIGDDMLPPSFALLPHLHALLGYLLPNYSVSLWEDAQEVEIGLAARVVR